MSTTTAPTPVLPIPAPTPIARPRPTPPLPSQLEGAAERLDSGEELLETKVFRLRGLA